MTKDKVIKVIAKYIEENLDDIEADKVDPNSSMKDYGANSLDMIEVVSCSMRELNIKIPRAELADIKTINELADKFMEHVLKKFHLKNFIYQKAPLNFSFFCLLCQTY